MRSVLLILIVAVTACRNKPVGLEPTTPAEETRMQPLAAVIKTVILKAERLNYSSKQSYSIEEMTMEATNPEVSADISLHNNTKHEVRVPTRGHHLWLRQIDGFFSDMHDPNSFRQLNDKPASVVGCESATPCFSIPPGGERTITFSSKLDLSTFRYLRDASEKRGMFTLRLVVQDPDSAHGNGLSEGESEIHKLTFKIPRVLMDGTEGTPGTG